MCKGSLIADALALESPESLILSAAPAPLSPSRQTRYKLWELQDCWYCMVIGTCLSLSDVRQSAIKAKLSVKSKNDYAIHQMAVECAANKQHPLSQRLQKLLEKKYAVSIKQYRTSKTADELRKLWSEGWESGEIASNLWALITHPLATRDIVLEVFEQVHMLSHLSGASVCVDRRLRLKQECQNSTLSKQLKALKSRYDAAKAMIREQKSLLETERANVRAFKAEANRVAEPLQVSLPAATTEIPSNLSHLIVSLRGKNKELRRNIVDEKALNQRQAHEIERLQRQLSAYENRSQESENNELKLCGQCVLYLGGKAQQRRHFQALVESSEGRFLHHDGGRENCPHRISELVSQADVVMCPTDCISHGAMEKARALCAKQDKPIVFMQRASLSSFTRSLQEALGDTRSA